MHCELDTQSELKWEDNGEWYVRKDIERRFQIASDSWFVFGWIEVRFLARGAAEVYDFPQFLQWNTGTVYSIVFSNSSSTPNSHAAEKMLNKPKSYKTRLKDQGQPRNVRTDDSPVYVLGGWFQNASHIHCNKTCP
jgi:hypothetical protein